MADPGRVVEDAAADEGLIPMGHFHAGIDGTATQLSEQLPATAAEHAGAVESSLRDSGPLEPLLDLKRASEVLGLAKVTIRKMVRKGLLSAVRNPKVKRLHFEPAVLRAYIAKSRTIQ